MESTATLVIKVNYGDMLRRFTVPINANGQLDLDMAGLRAKIISFLNLSSDAELSLTYIDEDGDVVTFVDDNDLLDVMKQRLKFLRINVKLSGNNPSDSSARASSGSSFLHAQDPLKNINKGINNILTAVPEPICETISKLSMDLASKPVFSSPVVVEILTCLSKLKQQASRPQQSDPSEHMEPNVTRDGGLPAKSTSLGTSASRVDLNLDPPCDSKGPFGDDGKEIYNERKPVNLDGSSSSADPKTLSQNTTGFVAGSSSECPFSGIPVSSNSNPMPIFMNPRVGHSKKSHNSGHWTSMGMFHKGIRCDGCGVLPITGPRFKSKIKEDYDLCSICFSKMGNETDYIRMDRPVSVRQARHFKGLCSPSQNPWFSHLPSPRPQKGLDSRLGKSKLDSRFILDVNVLDGTAMAPSTPFTKIWRLRNNGSLVWPRGVQLAWIGGDRLSDLVSVEIEIPEDGVPIDGELDVAVDFTAPELPGRYISYWRMASPSGAKFGQRVWVLIHVDASLKDSVCNSLQGLDLNASPDTRSSKVFARINVNGQSGHLGSSNVFTETENLVPDEIPKEDETNTPVKISFPFIDVPFTGPPATQAPSSPTVSYPIIDLTETNPVETSCETSSVKDVPISSEVNNGNKDVEMAMLKELEEMGFKQIDLNKEILRKCEYNLEQSVDTLCGVGDWDPILEELQEMGFCDEETNKKLLKKNNGSIKRVVMDLLNAENA